MRSWRRKQQYRAARARLVHQLPWPSRHFLHHPRREGNRQAAGNSDVYWFLEIRVGESPKICQSKFRKSISQIDGARVKMLLAREGPIGGVRLVGWMFYVILLSMRKLRNFSTDRCYHLISRVANKAFYFTEEERGRFAERMWRVAYFTCIWLLWKEKDILKLKKGLICVIRA